MQQKYREIHKMACKKCPTKNGLKIGQIDAETQEIKTYPKEIIVQEYLFPCAWRPNKLCKGLCDYFEITETHINEVIKKGSC